MTSPIHFDEFWKYSINQNKGQLYVKFFENVIFV